MLQSWKVPSSMPYSSTQNTESHFSLGLFHIPLIYLAGFHCEMPQHFSSEPVFSWFVWSFTNNNHHFQKWSFSPLLLSSFFPQKNFTGWAIDFSKTSFIIHHNIWLFTACTACCFFLRREVKIDTADIPLSVKKANFPLWGEVNMYI